VPYTDAMLLRAVRTAVVGAAVLLALHLFMLIGHGHARHGSMRSPGAMPHTAAPMDQPAGSMPDLEGALGAGVDMAATCFAVLAGLLVLGAGVRRSPRISAFSASAAASGGAASRRVRPRARSPVELCICRS
jgi:hypothetical protein